jgi:RimJ/RimL family protein N-acetyltransferase
MITCNRIRLCKKQLGDAADDYAWKTDPELAELDASSPLNISFSEYLFMYISELRMATPAKYEFSIETVNGEHIGNCAYYNINRIKGEAEIGIMLGNRQYWDRGYGTEAIISLVDYVFDHLKLKRVHLKTLDYNKRAQNCFIKCGFTPYGCKNTDGYNFVLMELCREKWQKHRMEAIQPQRESAPGGQNYQSCPG